MHSNHARSARSPVSICAVFCAALRAAPHFDRHPAGHARRKRCISRAADCDDEVSWPLCCNTTVQPLCLESSYARYWLATGRREKESDSGLYVFFLLVVCCNAVATANQTARARPGSYVVMSWHCWHLSTTAANSCYHLQPCHLRALTMPRGPRRQEYSL